MGFFDSTAITSNPTVTPSISGTINSLGAGLQNLTNITPVFSNSRGNYAPSYSFSTNSNPTVNSTTNLSLQLASNSPNSTFSASQTATQGLSNWLIAIGGVLLFFWLYKRYH